MKRSTIVHKHRCLTQYTILLVDAQDNILARFGSLSLAIKLIATNGLLVSGYTLRIKRLNWDETDIFELDGRHFAVQFPCRHYYRGLGEDTTAELEVATKLTILEAAQLIESGQVGEAARLVADINKLSAHYFTVRQRAKDKRGTQNARRPTRPEPSDDSRRWPTDSSPHS